jgi:hypothetical protein
VGPTCMDVTITPQEYTVALPSGAGTVRLPGGGIYDYFGVMAESSKDDFVDATIQAECASGDCAGAYVSSCSQGPIEFSNLAIPGRVQVRLGWSRQLGLCVANATPPKEATVIVRVSGTRHFCMTW